MPAVSEAPVVLEVFILLSPASLAPNDNASKLRSRSGYVGRARSIASAKSNLTGDGWPAMRWRAEPFQAEPRKPPHPRIRRRTACLRGRPDRLPVGRDDDRLAAGAQGQPCGTGGACRLSAVRPYPDAGVRLRYGPAA